MSRSGYLDDGDWDYDEWSMIRWSGAVKSAIRGARGQAFLKDLASALDALPEKRLAAGSLVTPAGEVCALGAVGRARGMNIEAIDPEDNEAVASAFGISDALAREVMYQNDDRFARSDEQRFGDVRRWAASQIKAPKKEEE